ncbi:DinB family protein [Pedobacter africanus]|uniref:Uncharacterized damage-inducible protein DinB (Forms a four-helix bundle) n=1 Tax=Pedobacter africanus TaxID=151894 RepID=A0A1W1ZJ00_9SPHI|nr:DinB family protein [Pedobacter africanus]SMC48357.1 Uncharacterized damage-inducible protein DinB (forms a four-helix bundle) [Pedobacter africanus]
MDTLKKQIIQELTVFYSGDPWVTENFEYKVATLNAETALQRISAFNHNIAEIVAHMTAWRNFVIKKLQGDITFNIVDNTKGDWPDANSWEETLSNFRLSQADLIRSLNNFSDNKWKETVPTRSYDFIYLVKGIVQHDYYHYGQIGCLIAAQKKLHQSTTSTS